MLILELILSIVVLISEIAVFIILARFVALIILDRIKEFMYFMKNDELPEIEKGQIIDVTIW